jgi:hypothetical protein
MTTEIVSFFADIDNRTYYSDHAKRLRQSCEDLGMPCDIRQLQATGSYRMNCLSKPRFLLEILKEKQRPFVWLDVDSIVHRPLEIFDDFESLYDLAFPYVGTSNPLMPNVSLIYINNTRVVFDFLNCWIDECEKNIHGSGRKVFDHEILICEVLPSFFLRMKIKQLDSGFAILPGQTVPQAISPMMTIGIADGDSKKNSLLEMGMSEEVAKANLIGNRYHS